jgi:hypothetical protein
MTGDFGVVRTQGAAGVDTTVVPGRALAGDAATKKEMVTAMEINIVF